MAKQLLTPKQVAKAIGVSESSLKRWCDRGLIPVVLTGGGHRRLPIEGVLTFIRQTKHTLVHPDLLGLPSITGRGETIALRAKERLQAAFLAGDEETCRQILFDLYLADYSLSEIFDNTIRPIFEALGKEWERGELSIYRERRSCRLCSRLLSELRGMIGAPASNAPVAIGGSFEGDHYELASTMAEVILRSHNWHATALGSNLPFTSFITAIQEVQPRLIWLSISYVPHAEQFLQDYHQFVQAVPKNIALVIGGSALTAELRREMHYSCFCESMQHLEGYLASLETEQAS